MKTITIPYDTVKETIISEFSIIALNGVKTDILGCFKNFEAVENYCVLQGEKLVSVKGLNNFTIKISG